MEIHHIGYLVKNMKKAIDNLLTLGYVQDTESFYDSTRDIDIVFMTNGGSRVELVYPRSAASPVYETLKSNGSGPYHICYYCDNMEAAIEECRRGGFVPTGEPSPAPAIAGHRVCFLYSRASGLIELLER